MPEAPILVLSASVPTSFGVGGSYLSSLWLAFHRPCVVAHLQDRRAGESPAAQVACPTINLPRRYEPAFKPVQGWPGSLAALAGARWMLARHVRRMVAPAAEFGRAHRVGTVLAVLECPTAMLLAAPLADALQCDLVSLVWDMPEHLLNNLGHVGASRRLVMRGFAKTMRRSRKVAVISDAMAQALESGYGSDTAVLHQPVEPEWCASIRDRQHGSIASASEWVIGFAGSVTARHELELLMQALDACGWRLNGRRVRLRVFGLRLLCEARSARCVEYRGYLPSTAEVVAGLAECDALFLPQSFETHQRLFTEYSFPTKLTTYLAARRPILVLTPEYGTLAGFFRNRAYPLLCTRNDVASVGGMLEAVATTPELACEAVRRLDVIAANEFSKPLFQRRVAELFACA